MKAGRLAITLLFLVGTLGGCVGAMQTKAVEPVGTAGLKPTQEDKHAGLVGVASGFDLKAYRVIAVARFPVSQSEVKDDEDRKMADRMPSYFQAELVRHLRDTGLFERVVNLSETDVRAEGAGVLKLEGTITRLDPGSRALRYWVGFGAGRTKAQAETSFVDGASGRVVMVTADRRAAALGVFGGDSEDHLKESFDDMARDLARFLVRLSKGEAPKTGD